MKHLVVLTGAGMSAESGIKTFRGEDGLWEDHDVMQVASPKGFASNPELVLEFYNQRRRQLLQVSPNQAHLELANLEKHFKVTIITQNIDDLHERAGSTNVIHLHGELLKVRSTRDENFILDWKTDLNLGDVDKHGHQLRPHIVWFGEEVPLMEKAINICSTADKLLIIGTSLQVYPAASLMHFVPQDVPKFYIDPNPSISSTKSLTVIPEIATKGINTFISVL
ncbi:SIR2 family NAD-dependent protein deacylase [Olleya aquimaris]|uniref:NAD-dependent protein deacylase n=1 Tax=Olleya aquimaris TaxID=639310 RepID=A0A327RLE8_9FLAO|nr:NAD-dependent deacylase [Olleya aquimaris]RAJ17025.1 NAD-dependent deacetylase [Olleya aquimaris]